MQTFMDIRFPREESRGLDQENRTDQEQTSLSGAPWSL